jgi:hypothetical protein
VSLRNISAASVVYSPEYQNARQFVTNFTTRIHPSGLSWWSCANWLCVCTIRCLLYCATYLIPYRWDLALGFVYILWVWAATIHLLVWLTGQLSLPARETTPPTTYSSRDIVIVHLCSSRYCRAFLDIQAMSFVHRDTVIELEKGDRKHSYLIPSYAMRTLRFYGIWLPQFSTWIHIIWDNLLSRESKFQFATCLSLKLSKVESTVPYDKHSGIQFINIHTRYAHELLVRTCLLATSIRAAYRTLTVTGWKALCRISMHFV